MAGFTSSGPHDHLPRLPQGLRRVARRPRREVRRLAGAPAHPGRAAAGHGVEHRAGRPLHPPSEPLHRAHASWPSSKNSRSGGPRPTRRSSARSPAVTTCSSEGRRWCPRGSRSPSPVCSRSISRSSSTTSSPPRWRTPSTRSPEDVPTGSRCSVTSTSVRSIRSTRACTRSSTNWATSTRGSCRRSRSAISTRASSCGSGRYGTYVEDEEGNRANVEATVAPDELTAEVARELLATPAGHRA